MSQKNTEDDELMQWLEGKAEQLAHSPGKTEPPPSPKEDQQVEGDGAGAQPQPAQPFPPPQEPTPEPDPEPSQAAAEPPQQEEPPPEPSQREEAQASSPGPSASDLPGNEPLPPGVLAHLLLIEIAGTARRNRELPRYLPLKKYRSLAGRHVKANLNLDDESTVAIKHAKIIYEERENRERFVIYPIDTASVYVNDSQVSGAGMPLVSGDLVAIGSARLIFFQKNL